jgi:hypothetical protein
VQDEQWTKRFERFPEHTPMNKEYYLLRSIFEERFPSAAALHTVPKGLSIACSTPEAVSWDPSWANIHDISGRAVAAHDASADYSTAEDHKMPPVGSPVSGQAPVTAADNEGAKGAVSGAVVTMMDGAAGTSVNGHGISTNGATKERSVTTGALPQPRQMRTMHVSKSRARGQTALSPCKAGRAGLRIF